MRNLYVGVGCEPQQELPFQLLKFSIEQFFDSDKYKLDIFPIHSIKLDVSIENSILKKQGTPFSFQRFIFANWFLDKNNDQDIGIYLDSDMLVFDNLEKLIDAFELLQQDIGICDTKSYWQRKQQQAVMVFNLNGASEISKKFQMYLSNEINYEKLMSKPDYKKFLPYFWNSQEEIMHDTKLIHYTDMDFQPWLRKDNVNAGIWLSYLRLFLQNQSSVDILKDEIIKHNVRPSLGELINNPPNFPVYSFSWSIRDIFFIPPHRLRSIKGNLRILLSPLLNLVIYIQKIIKNNRINKI
tara:strand:+ start:8157 stop:9047 length:891 start_codon:yes stop_codon:yes gene_type:complete